MDQLATLLHSHLAASHTVVAVVAVCVAKIDSIILFLLRFFPAATIKAEVDRLAAAADARIDKDAAKPVPVTGGGSSPTGQP